MTWCPGMLWLLGARVTVYGRDRVPSDRRLCIVANHQSCGNTLMIQGHLGRAAGFTAKRELATIPVLGSWMRLMGCVFVERSNPRSSRRALDRGVRNIMAGHPMVVFPEGTRSRGCPVAPFKPGAVRLALDSGATILPVTISGTARLHERQGYLKSGPVTMSIHPPLGFPEYRHLSKQALAGHLRSIIVSAMPARV